MSSPRNFGQEVSKYAVGSAGNSPTVHAVQTSPEMGNMSPALLASSMDNKTTINGMLIPSSSTISLLSLGNNAGSPPDSTSPSSNTSLKSPLRASFIGSGSTPRNQSLLNQERLKYYLPTSNQFTPSHTSRLSAQLKSSVNTAAANSTANSTSTPQSPISPMNPISSKMKGRIASEFEHNSWQNVAVPDSPSLDPSSLTSSPSKFIVQPKHDDLARNISHLSLNERANSPIIQLKKQRSGLTMNHSDGFTRSKNITIQHVGNESPVLRPVQTPGSEICMTPLMLNYKHDDDAETAGTTTAHDREVPEE